VAFGVNFFPFTAYTQTLSRSYFFGKFVRSFSQSINNYKALSLAVDAVASVVAVQTHLPRIYSVSEAFAMTCARRYIRSTADIILAEQQLVCGVKY
jgi:hypothetical protein